MTDIFNHFYQGKRVLVTGHTGFKGSWLSIWLHEMGAEVIGVGLEPFTPKDNFVLYDFASGKEKYYTWDKENTREIVPVQENEEHKKMVKHYKSGIAIAQYMLDKPEK